MNRHQHHLLHLTYIRTLILFVVCITLVIAVPRLRLQPDLLSTGLCLAALILLNLMTYLRLHSNWPVLDAEFFAQLCADVIIYAALLYQFGGASNPFVFVLLLPLIVCATTLPRKFTLLMALLVAGLYSSLMFNHLPLLDFSAAHQHTLVQLFHQHITGLWISFLLTVGVISVYVVQMRNALIERDQQLGKAREQRIHDRQLLTLATLAAGTAHELRTPLSTLRVVLSDLQQEHPELDADLSLMQQQIDLCNSRLRQLSEEATLSQPQPQRCDLFLSSLLDAWQLMRPQAAYRLTDVLQPAPCIQASMTLQQALINLLNNAADASPDAIEISLTATATDRITLTLRDRGPGLTAEQLANLGKPFFTTKGGLGIGLFLTVTSLATQEGEVRLYNHPGGGTLTEVSLPTCPCDPEEAENV
ncbi:Sensor histidine kinase PrrB (RegB) [Nitrincola lacisaponensis]|uniref:histidine kinase n=1 Tax=Nitrincola lacisaponensis TaxID=267850 RepID=A0A063Y7X0_9GAMM|nr:ATP-binding protein [Nitrincola lacisaponensis]KDE40467.1 Sensor histidine kinase PrrB (RegB) [Nitrincola lacisaponensis]